MAKIIVWNKRAEAELDKIIQYLLYKWGDKVTADYLIRVNYITEFIAQNPNAGIRLAINKDIRSFLITKHAKLIYRFSADKIIILNV